jgi:hypothetical protein
VRVALRNARSAGLGANPQGRQARSELRRKPVWHGTNLRIAGGASSGFDTDWATRTADFRWASIWFIDCLDLSGGRVISYSERHRCLGFVVDGFAGFEGQWVGELEGDTADEAIYVIDTEDMTRPGEICHIE